MKNLLNKLTAIIICIFMLSQLNACSFGTEDVNNIVDNAFKNYQSMNSTESGAYSNFKDINIQSSYLGYGYDVINDPYMGARYINTSYPILDINKIDNVSLLMEKENHGNYEEYDKSTMEELYQTYATSINVYGKVGKCFSGGLKLDFSGNQNEKTYYHFYKLNYYYDAFYISITNTVEELEEYLSESFKNDLKTMPVKDLFDRYGTHLIKEASMGGRIEKSVTYTSNSSSNKSQMDAAVNAHIKAIGASINTEVSTSASQALENAGVTSTTKISQLGGKAVSLSGEVNYEKWAESFDESLEYAALCGVKNENSLVGIWELLPSGFETRKTEIENAFIQLSGDKYLELCNTFKLTQSTETPEDKTWSIITKTTERKSIHDNNKYNVNNINPDQSTIDRHNGWELGTFKLYGLEESNNKFIVKNEEDISIKYNLEYNLDELPLSSELQYNKVNYDEQGGVVGTSLPESDPIGKGAYWIRVTYTDDTTSYNSAVNCLDGKVKGDYIELLSAKDIDSNKVIKKIDVVFVYELVCGHNGHLGFIGWWSYVSNFRCDFTINFQ